MPTRKQHTRSSTIAAILGLSLCSALGSAQAAETSFLKDAMRGLNQKMQVIVDGLAREDYAQVEKTAVAIATHPKPPLQERMRIMGFVGTRMGEFKGYDDKTHHAAETLAAAARRKDGRSAVEAFKELQTGCLECHQAFRHDFVAHFGGKAK
ncbi:MAG: cytochrome C [Pseudomonadota bacterium]